MFERYEARVRLARRGGASTDTEQKPSVAPEDIKEMTQETITYAAVTVVLVAGAITAMTTASKILVNVTNPGNYKK